jgi:hypothetical protein
MKKLFLFSFILLSSLSFQISGQMWSGITRLTWNAGGSYFPSIAADSGIGIYVVWQDDSLGDSEIFYKRSTNSGISWFGMTRLTWNTGYSTYPSIAADSSGGIHVVWTDTSPGSAEIFYKYSSDSGASWSAVTRLTWNAGGSWTPFIAADSLSCIHVVWDDDAPGNNEIFYKNRK